ncbi:MAG: nucleoside recognition protein [Lachnospiraceae bacterium]|nr:nucleoside recognition protein [Lachnospira sp.]MBR6697789.1 nucleoside recognition protein [Lachnospiraceae bacterium]
MLNYIWAIMIIVGVVYAIITGNIGNVTNGILESSEETISLCITMLGIMSVWTGLMEIARQCGLIQILTRRLDRLIGWIFCDIPKGHKALEYITTNIVANFLGLGWAATPAGLMAMKEMAKLNKNNPTMASDSMCAFLIINVSSIQLVPITMIAYRNQYGSVNPVSIMLPAILSTCVSTLVAIIFIKIKQGKRA